jgi:hypothetical protein
MSCHTALHRHSLPQAALRQTLNAHIPSRRIHTLSGETQPLKICAHAVPMRNPALCTLFGPSLGSSQQIAHRRDHMPSRRALGYMRRCRLLLRGARCQVLRAKIGRGDSGPAARRASLPVSSSVPEKASLNGSVACACCQFRM